MTDAVVCLHDAAEASAGRRGRAGAVHPAAERLARLVEREPERLEAAGIRAWLAPGVPPGYAATAGVAAALERLPELLGRPGVAAVGGIGPGEGTPLELRALRLQLGLAAERRLPALVCLPRKGRPAAVRRVLALALEARLPAARICFAHVNLPALREARRAGTRVAIGVHPAELDPDRAARLVARHGAEGVCLGSMLGVGPGDVLALPRIGRALEREGVAARAAEAALWANASDWLTR